MEIRTCIHSRRCRVAEEFSRQTRRVFAGMLGAFQENATQYDRKRPAHTVVEVVTTGSKLAPFGHIDIKFMIEECLHMKRRNRFFRMTSLILVFALMLSLLPTQALALGSYGNPPRLWPSKSCAWMASGQSRPFPSTSMGQKKTSFSAPRI